MVQSLAAVARRTVAINGGRVDLSGAGQFCLSPVAQGYADAQIDDYGERDAGFRRRPGATLSLRARFSHPAGALVGPAGFGFWNAPYGDASRRRPTLPQAVWFFYASAPSDLPFAPEPHGRGWFAGVLDAGAPPALPLIPAVPIVLLLNQFAAARCRVWPAVRRRLGIYAAPVEADLTARNEYRLAWGASETRFWVDGRELLTVPSPRSPLGFVCRLDNQYRVLTPRGRFRAGTLAVTEEQ